MLKKVSLQVLIWGLILILAIPFGAFAQNTAPPTSPQFKQEELDQMLAPIALYPDSLLVQILMASTYPLEIVEAARWAKANQNLKGDPLTTALEKQNWDPSVKSLVNFPSVLAMMNDKLDWTQKLGDAFLSQEKGVMDTVQKLRAKAQAQGTLKSTDQQKVTTQAQTIIIEPASPQVVYIPAYNPAVVYGPWMYPAYPPYPYYPPGAVIGASVVSFGVGVAVGAAWGYAWGGCNWNHGSVNVNVNQNNTINNNINRNKYTNNANVSQTNNINRANVSQNTANINRNNTNKVGGDGSTEWQHDPAHRKGVAYRDNATQQKYGQQRDRGSTDARNDYRGHTTDDRGRTGQANDRQGMQDRKDVQGRDRPDAQGRQTDSRKGSASAFDGMDRSGSEARMQSERGRASSQSMSSARDGGGSARSSGGGMSRGGGGRR